MINCKTSTSSLLSAACQCHVKIHVYYVASSQVIVLRVRTRVRIRSAAATICRVSLRFVTYVSNIVVPNRPTYLGKHKIAGTRIISNVTRFKIVKDLIFRETNHASSNHCPQILGIILASKEFDKARAK